MSFIRSEDRISSHYSETNWNFTDREWSPRKNCLGKQSSALILSLWKIQQYHHQKGTTKPHHLPQIKKSGSNCRVVVVMQGPKNIRSSLVVTGINTPLRRVVLGQGPPGFFWVWGVEYRPTPRTPRILSGWFIFLAFVLSCVGSQGLLCRDEFFLLGLIPVFSV